MNTAIPSDVRTSVSSALFVYGQVHRLVARAAELGRTTAQTVIEENRARELAWLRFAVMWVAHAKGNSYSAIGRALGRRDPSTIRHGVRRAEHFRTTDPVFLALCDELEAV